MPLRLYEISEAQTGEGVLLNDLMHEDISDIPDILQQQIVRNYKQKHFANRADESLHALGGKTPQEAVRTAHGRKAVVALLKKFECPEEHEHSFDFSFL